MTNNKLGIDFGTSFCKICALTPEGAKVIKFDNKKDKMPTAIFWEKNDNVLIGEDAVNRFEDLPPKSKDYSRYITSIKSEFVNNRPIILPNKQITPVTAMAKILSYLIEQGEKYFKGTVDEVTLTCPAYFGKTQFELYLEALRAAGVKNYTLTEDRTLLREPVAAALAHFNESQLQNRILVYDLGGGTFDLAYVYRGDDGLWSIPVKAVGIKKDCAGDYFDKLIYDAAKKQIKELQARFNKEKRYDKGILAECRSIKEDLSKKDSVEIPLIAGKKFKLTRIDFENLIRDKLEATMHQTDVYLRDVLAANSKRTNQRDLNKITVLLNGGSTQIPLIRKMLEKTLKEVLGDKCSIDIIPSDNDTAVAEGAAKYFPDVDSLQSLKEFDENDIVPRADLINVLSEKMLYNNVKHCQNCGAPLYAESGICYSCGEICDNFLIPQHVKSNKQIRENIRKRVMSFRNNLKQVSPPSSTLWSSSSARYARAIERIKLAISNKEVEGLPETINLDNWNKIQSLCTNCEFHIALVGTLNAGKSTLLNAILGHEDLASTSVTPETASVTKFRASKIDTLSIKVTFYSKEEWKTIWKDVEEAENKHPNNPSSSEQLNGLSSVVFKNEYNKYHAESVKQKYLGHKPDIKYYDNIQQLRKDLSHWTSSKCPENFFVKEVEVSLNNDNLPDSLKDVSTDIIFVDTPGLNDVVTYRSNITADYILNANVVLACISKDLTSDSTYNIIKLFQNCKRDRVYILGTQIDSFESPVNNWDVLKKEWVDNYFRDDLFYGDESIAQNLIMGVSALTMKYLLLFSNDPQNQDYLDWLVSMSRKLGFIKCLTEGASSPQRYLPGGDVYEKLLDFANINNLIERIKSDFIQRHKYLLLRDIQKVFEMCCKELKTSTREWISSGLSSVNMSSKELSSIKAKQKKLQNSLNKLETNSKAIDKEFTNFQKGMETCLSALKKLILNKD